MVGGGEHSLWTGEVCMKWATLVDTNHFTVTAQQAFHMEGWASPESSPLSHSDVWSVRGGQNPTLPGSRWPHQLVTVGKAELKGLASLSVYIYIYTTGSVHCSLCCWVGHLQQHSRMVHGSPDLSLVYPKHLPASCASNAIFLLCTVLPKRAQWGFVPGEGRHWLFYASGAEGISLIPSFVP